VRALALAAGLVPAAGCSEAGPTEVVFEVIQDVTFDASLGIDLSLMTELPSGVYIEDRTVGQGAVIAAGNTASIDHSGWLRTGVGFSGGQFSFDYLVDDLIDGFEIGMEGMAEGGTRLMILPPELAYGADPPPGSGIPPGAILVFEVELLALS
jgi:peptidylprolyl isomerase